MSWFTFSWQNFWFSFLALAFEGLPFVLLGSLLSGFIAAFVPSRTITRLLPKNRFLAILVSGLLGVLFPICECGIVPVVRRLLGKGLPLSCGITFMLASPIVNPIVALSTFAAFRGQDPWLNLWVRLGFGYLVSVLVGLVLIRVRAETLFRPSVAAAPGIQRRAFSIAPLPDSVDQGNTKRFARTIAAIQLAGDDFIDTAVYFMIGAAVAALFNTAVDQRVIAPLASHRIWSVVALTGLSGILTLCSTSDAFIAATFTAFPLFARMAFLVFGPMFDFKLLFLYSVLFRKRFVLLLGVGLFVVVGVLSASVLPLIYAQ